MKTQRVELHEFGDFGKRAIFHVARRSFYEIDSETSQVLALCDGRSVEKIVSQVCPEISEPEVRGILKELETAQILVSENVSPFVDYYPPEKIEILHLDLRMTTDCPPSCVRCYLAQTKKPLHTLKQRMTLDIAQQAVEFLMKESGKLDCYLTFSGMGIYADCEWIRKVISYANKAASLHAKQIYFEIVIDSSLFVEELFTQAFMNQQNVMITVNIKSSEAIRQMLERYSKGFTRSENGPQVGLNIFVDGYLPTLKALIHQAIQVFSPQSLYVIPTVIADSNTSATKSEINGAKQLLRELCEYCLQYALKKGETWIGHICDQAESVLKHTRYYYYCGAGTRHLAILPDGDLYPCAELATDMTHRMGNVKTGVLKKERKVWLQDYHVDQFETCASCWARYLCGGGCRADSLLNCGSLTEINEVTCDLIRYSYELAMLMSLIYFSGENELVDVG